MLRSIKLLSVCVAVVLATSMVAQAGVINVDFNNNRFGDPSTVTYNGTTAIDNATSYGFNQIMADNLTGGSSILKYAAGSGLGADSGVTVTLSTGSANTNTASTGFAPNLFRDGPFAPTSGSGRTFTLSGLSTSETYDLYLYGSQADAYAGYGVDFTINGVTKSTTGAGGQGQFVNGVNYVKYAGLTTGTGTISGSWNGFASMGYEGMFNGFTLSFGEVPEPSAVVLLITGLIGLLCYAWRKRK